jgi:hypothetical protein
MTHVRGEDEGVYMCRASNALGEAVTTASMKIRSKFCFPNELFILVSICYVRINLPLFSTVVSAIIFVFLSCRPFVAITTSVQKHDIF